METLRKIEEGFVGITMLAVVIMLTVNIFLRFFFSSGISWSEEFIRYGIIWITFIGSAICFRRGIHVGIDLLMESLAEKNRRILSLIINILSIILMLLLIKYGMDLVMFSVNTGQLMAALQLKMYWVYISIPLGAFLSLIHLLIQTFGMIKKTESST